MIGWFQGRLILMTYDTISFETQYNQFRAQYDFIAAVHSLFVGDCCVRNCKCNASLLMISLKQDNNDYYNNTRISIPP